MRERQLGNVLFWCDGRCNTMMDAATGSFRVADKRLKAMGWQMRDGGHYCPECLKKITIKLAADRAERRQPKPYEKWR